MESLENLVKEIKDSKTIKSYLLSNISYYDYLMYNEKQKLLTEKLDVNKTNKIVEMFTYYQKTRDIYVSILNDFEEKGIKVYD